jgi:hypothetical protein
MHAFRILSGTEHWACEPEPIPGVVVLVGHARHDVDAACMHIHVTRGWKTHKQGMHIKHARCSMVNNRTHVANIHRFPADRACSWDSFLLVTLCQTDRSRSAAPESQTARCASTRRSWMCPLGAQSGSTLMSVTRCWECSTQTSRCCSRCGPPRRQQQDCRSWSGSEDRRRCAEWRMESIGWCTWSRCTTQSRMWAKKQHEGWVLQTTKQD